MRHVLSLVLVALVAPIVIAADGPAEDPFLWLEEVQGADALAWVKGQNERSTSTLEEVPEFEAIRLGILAVYDSDEKIPDVAIRGEYLYNFWQDATHVRGIWRRTSIEEYRKEKPTWETVLDLDRLAEVEGENWAWGELYCLPPEYRRCMIGMSRGGTDAKTFREFDTVDKTFVEDGFVVPEAKSDVRWRDRDTLWVATDFGEGTLTTSGYPRIAKRWSRGTPLAEAATVLEVPESHVGVRAYSDHTPDGRYDLVMDIPQFYRGNHYIVLDGRKVRFDLPLDVDMKGLFKDQLLISLRTDWTVSETTYPQGALLAIDLDEFLQGERAFDTLFEPSERISLDTIATTRNWLILTTLDNVRGRLHVMGFQDGAWSRHEVPTPGLGTVEITSTSYSDDTWFFTYTDFLTPSTLFLVDEDLEPVAVKSSPTFFDASGMEVAQYEATSKDGTSIPYFVVTPEGFEANGTAPTVLYGYGGFEIPMLPKYSGTSGSAWLARGGVWVLSNIRGGGEFGPRWHQGVLKENRHKVYEDFIAVAEDLTDRKITSPEHLGIMGGSQGGLLVGVAVLQRPDLFGAVVSQVPLLDMGRYHKLLAGASWMGEYGNPDVPEEWAFIQTWSPYHMVRKDVDYPEIFFRTNTRDDRVHPGHPRKMVARMLDQGHPVLYWEDIQGGHSAGTTNEARAYGWALDYAYLWMKLR
jgi:prolyl oligopeptidase